MPRIQRITLAGMAARASCLARRGRRGWSRLAIRRPTTPAATEIRPSTSHNSEASRSLRGATLPVVTCRASQVEKGATPSEPHIAERTGSKPTDFGSPSERRSIESGLVPAPNVSRVSGCFAGGSFMPALPQSFEPFENARLDERGADGAFDEDEAVADGGGEEALGAQQRDAHAGDGDQPHDQH